MAASQRESGGEVNGSSASLLETALEGLSVGERYNVVLQGMLTRRAITPETLTREVIPLMHEMKAKNERLDDKTRAALIDGACSAVVCGELGVPHMYFPVNCRLFPSSIQGAPGRRTQGPWRTSCMQRGPWGR